MSMTDINAGLLRPGHAQGARIPTQSGAAQVVPRFYTELRKTDQVDPTTGTSKFVEVEYVQLLMPGQKDAPVKRVTDEIRSIYANFYAQWKATKVNPDMIGDGIPLALWPTCPTTLAKSLELINVFTVQQLAEIPDTVLTQPGTIGLRDYRDKARAFIESAKTTAPIARLESENGDLKRRLDLLQAQMTQLIERADDLQRQNNELQGGGASAPTPKQQRKTKEEN